MAHRDAIVAFADELLAVARFPEFGPPGLQVVGADEVTKIVCGVSSSLELFRRAAGAGAQLVLVHHGLFWRNEPLVVERRLRARLQTLFEGDLSLVAYHIALDAQPEVGNNAQLALRLGIAREHDFGGIGVGGRLAEPTPLDELVRRVAATVGREPLVLGDGAGTVERVAVSTGAAGHDLVRAALDGYDVLVTGEPEEPSLHTALELGVHLIAGGHYATERFGVQALAQRIAAEFDLEWEFLDIENPV